MNARKLISYIGIALVVSTAACATGGKTCHWCFTKGRIIEIHENEVVFCTGIRSRAEVGKLYPVYRLVPAEPGFTRHYDREYTGMVKIIELTGCSRARAQIVTGSVQPDEEIEL